MITILIVENDPLELELLQKFLAGQGYAVEAVAEAPRALALVRENARAYDLVVLDYNLGEMDGADLSEAILALRPDQPILIFSADVTQRSVIRSVRKGARAFVGKSEGPEAFLREMRKILGEENASQNSVGDSAAHAAKISALGMVGQSAALAQLADAVAKLREKSGPVLLLGESGTGKELLARALHGDRKGPFRAINCASFWMSLDTARSELFGHVRGAFTGADRDRDGVFVGAAGGTVFLDEIYALPPEAQVGILRALQERTITPVGSHREVAVDCRIVAAAKPDLFALTERGSFKKDLFYRISENILRSPSLAERPEDIAPLVDYFCSRWCEENRETKVFLKSALPVLEAYGWPGNVNELKNVVYSTLNTSGKSKIGAKDIGEILRERLGEEPVRPSGTWRPLKNQFEVAEREHLAATLRNSPSIRAAARRLGISAQSVLRKIKKYELSAPDLVGKNKK